MGSCRGSWLGISPRSWYANSIFGTLLSENCEPIAAGPVRRSRVPCRCRQCQRTKNQPRGKERVMHIQCWHSIFDKPFFLLRPEHCEPNEAKFEQDSLVMKVSGNSAAGRRHMHNALTASVPG